jgi:hypothetical protein
MNGQIWSVWRLSTNAKKVSANTKSSLAAIFALQVSAFLSTFVAVFSET